MSNGALRIFCDRCPALGSHASPRRTDFTSDVAYRMSAGMFAHVRSVYLPTYLVPAVFDIDFEEPHASFLVQHARQDPQEFYLSMGIEQCKRLRTSLLHTTVEGCQQDVVLLFLTVQCKCLQGQGGLIPVQKAPKTPSHRPVVMSLEGALAAIDEIHSTKWSDLLTRCNTVVCSCNHYVSKTNRAIRIIVIIRCANDMSDRFRLAFTSVILRAAVSVSNVGLHKVCHDKGHVAAFSSYRASRILIL